MDYKLKREVVPVFRHNLFALSISLYKDSAYSEYPQKIDILFAVNLFFDGLNHNILPPLLFSKTDFMARQDIIMDAEYGEVETFGNVAGKSFHAFRLLDAVAGADNDTYRYGEIAVPEGFDGLNGGNGGIHVLIPYTPDMRRLMVRFVIKSGSGGTAYLKNPVTGKFWFPVLSETDAGTADIALAALFAINGNGIYRLLPREGHLAVYSGEETDFGIGPAKAQNGTFLLKASAGNLYRHPTTGVGLIDYLHSSLENNGLAAKLQSEFAADRVIIKNAYMDSATGELLLETVEKEDSDG